MSWKPVGDDFTVTGFSCWSVPTNTVKSKVTLSLLLFSPFLLINSFSWVSHKSTKASNPTPPFLTHLLTLSSSVGQCCLCWFPFLRSLYSGVPALSLGSSLFVNWTYCVCSLALSHPSCPSAWHVPSAASAGDILSNCQRAPMCYSVCLCMFVWICV